MSRLGAIILLLAGVTGLLPAGRELLWQDRLVRYSRPATARVLSCTIPGLSYKNANSFIPAIRYRYTVGSQTCESTQIWPYSDSLDLNQAHEFAGHFRPTATITAYTHPDHPATSILIRNYSSIPYWPIASALLAMWAGGSALLRLSGPDKNQMIATPADPPGWQQLAPTKSLRDNVRQAWLLLLTTGIPMIALSAHMASLSVLPDSWNDAIRPISPGAWGWLFILLAVTALIGETILVWRAWNAARFISDPRLFVSPALFKRGEDFSLRVAIDAYRPLLVTELLVSVICIEHALMHTGRYTQFVKKIVGQKMLHVIDQPPTPAGGVIGCTGVLQFDSADWPATGRRGVLMYPFCKWEVHIQLSGTRGYTATFPITVT